jgi:carbonic anhydrase
MIPALEALIRLAEGNRRFVEGDRGAHVLADEARRAELLNQQNPFAIVLGCSDSRVPMEIVFDQGLGDIFAIRVAGNVTGPALVGSVEFAAAAFGTRLVVVLGHSKCGAIQATLAELQRPSDDLSPNLRAILERIRPSVEGLLASDLAGDPEALVAHAVRANIQASAEYLRRGSRLLERLIREEGLLVVGAEYCLATGEVEFFDGIPDEFHSAAG